MSPRFYFITTKLPGSANISSCRFPWVAFSLLCGDVDNFTLSHYHQLPLLLMPWQRS